MNEIKKYQRNKNCVKTRIQDEHFILDLTTDKYLRLNYEGGYIWDLLETPLALEDIIVQIQKKFNTNDSKIKEIELFLNECIEIGVLKFE